MEGFLRTAGSLNLAAINIPQLYGIPKLSSESIQCDLQVTDCVTLTTQLVAGLGQLFPQL